MKTPNEFWLALHEAAQTLEGEGTTEAERAANILTSFHSMPPVAQEQLREELLELLSFLPDLYSSVAKDAPPRRVRGSASVKKHA